MSNELDKLAAEMRKMKPSKSSRQGAMDAAMSAFSAEFSTEKTTEKSAVSESNVEKSATATQGLKAAARPTGQTIRPAIRIGRVQTFGKQTMAKFSALTNFKPQTMMMAGTCAAALIAGLIVLPNMGDVPGMETPAVVAPVEVVADNNTAKRSPEAVTETLSPEISEARNESPEVGDRAAKSVATQSEPTPTDVPTPATAPTTDTPSNVVTIERRIVKTPGRTEERVIPAVLDTIERRVQISPERAEWKEVYTDPKDLAAGGQNYSRVIVPAEYKTTEEKVVLRPETVEYINIPPVYETVKETIRINEDGSTEVLSSEIVPTEVIKSAKVEPVVANLRGVLNEAPITPEPETPVAKTPAVPAQPPVTAAPIVVSQNNVGRVNTNTKGQFTVFNGVSNQLVESTETIVSQTGEILCRVMIPATYKTITKQVVKTPARSVERSIPAVTKEVTVKVPTDDGSFKEVSKTFVLEPARVEYVATPPTYETRTERVLIAPARQEWKPGSQAINAGALGVQPAPTASRGITSVDSLLNNVRTNSAKVEVENRARAAQFQQRANQQSALIGTAPGFVAPPPASAPVAGAVAPEQPRETEKFAGLTLEQSAPEFITKTETIVIQPASVEYVTVPATYETVKESVVVQEASTELVTIPGVYEWVDGEIEGSTVEYVKTSAEFEMVKETVVVQPASVEYVSLPKVFETVKETIVIQPEYLDVDGSVVPAITEEISRRIVKTPASTVERTIPAVTKEMSRRVVKTPSKVIEREVPYEIKDGKTRIPVTPARTVERALPSVTKTETRRRVKTPASTVERTIPAVTKQVQVKVIAPPKFYLRDDDGNVVREFASRDAFEIYKANLPTPVTEKPVSTFSVDVDTASYSFMRASINRGELPPRESIRLEEMINYFPYDYDAPKSADEPFKANVTVTSNPWNVDTKLMHIGIQGYVPKEAEKPRNNLVFLIDTSGSMKDANKLPLLKNSFKLLLNTLDKEDTVSIVTYTNTVDTALEPTPVKRKSEILEVLNNLHARGGTAGAAGLQLAYENAEKNFDPEGNNRVILASDGDFNVGFSSPEEMKSFISKKRDTGISLSVLGFGKGNYNDHLMQSLAQNGNGVAAYIDSLSEANKVLANEAGGALITIAKDVKIQVEFNPATIAEYRLIGYETRALKRQDFNNDKVDAGEIGAGHSVTAIYEMTPVGSPAITLDKLRYVSEEPKTNTGSDEYAFVKIRHKLPTADTSTLQTFPIGKRQERSLKRASDDMRFATAVSIVGQKLRGDTAVEGYSYKDAIKLAKGAKGKDEDGYRAEFIQLVKLIETMEK